MSETAKADGRLQLLRGKASTYFAFNHLDAASDMSFGALSEAIRRVSKHPESPPRCDQVVRMVLIGLGVSSRKTKQALPLPALSLPPGPASGACIIDI